MLVEGVKRFLGRRDRRVAIRVMVVSDIPYVRRLVARKLGAAPDLFLVGRPVTEEEATFFLEEERPDVIVLDLDMADDAALSWLDSLSPEDRKRCILLTTQSTEDIYVDVALSLEPAGYVRRTGDEMDVPRVMKEIDALITQIVPNRDPAPPARVPVRTRDRQQVVA